MTGPSDAILIYDGDCPFCSRYVHLLRLKDALGRIELVNAREGGEAVRQVIGAGYDLDEGMVLLLGNRIYHGADCIHRLSLMATDSSLFNRLNAMIFRSRTLSRLLYPVLRFGRNSTLRLLGRQRFDPANVR